MADQHIDRAIGRLEGKLDSVITSLGGVQGEMKSLRDDFSTMEKGRLTRLEVQYATLATEIEGRAKNMAGWISAGVSIVTSVLSALFIYLFIG